MSPNASHELAQTPFSRSSTYNIHHFECSDSFPLGVVVSLGDSSIHAARRCTTIYASVRVESWKSTIHASLNVQVRIPRSMPLWTWKLTRDITIPPTTPHLPTIYQYERRHPHPRRQPQSTTTYSNILAPWNRSGSYQTLVVSLLTSRIDLSYGISLFTWSP